MITSTVQGKERFDRIVQSFENCSKHSGSMLLEYVSKIAKLGHNPQQVLLIDVWDIDQKCVNMCYLQLNLYGLRAAVTHGDTLSNKVYAKHYTLMYMLNGAISGIRGGYNVG